MNIRIVLLAASAIFMTVPVMAQADAPAPPKEEGGADVVMVRNISHVELAAGDPIADSTGEMLGTVKKVAGNTIIVTDGHEDYHVPVAEIYAYSRDGSDHFASRVPKSALTPEG